MPKITWLGDEDSSAQKITQYGHVFVKGEPTNVPDNDPMLDKFKSMGVFSVGKAGDVVEIKEPEPTDPDEGTERAAVKAELDAAGIKYDGRAKLETLRELLAK
jgi:hypothetical protein